MFNADSLLIEKLICLANFLNATSFELTTPQIKPIKSVQSDPMGNVFGNSNLNVENFSVQNYSILISFSKLPLDLGLLYCGTVVVL